MRVDEDDPSFVNFFLKCQYLLNFDILAPLFPDDFPPVQVQFAKSKIQ